MSTNGTSIGQQNHIREGHWAPAGAPRGREESSLQSGWSHAAAKRHLGGLVPRVFQLVEPEG